MKKTTTQKPLHDMKDKHQRPENKDNLDSRTGEEQDDKGSDTTHNKKETKEKKTSLDKAPFKNAMG